MLKNASPYLGPSSLFFLLDTEEMRIQLNNRSNPTTLVNSLYDFLYSQPAFRTTIEKFLLSQTHYQKLGTLINPLQERINSSKLSLTQLR